MIVWAGKSREKTTSEELATAATCRLNASLWQSAPLALGSSNSKLIVDLSAVPRGKEVIAVRYGWPLSKGADTCCPFVQVKNGLMPCVPGSCPIVTERSSLPANPFFAAVSEGKCKCLEPQSCDG